MSAVTPLKLRRYIKRWTAEGAETGVESLFEYRCPHCKR